MICPHELRRVKNFVSTYNAKIVTPERPSADAKSAAMDSTGVERALKDARYLENDAPTARAHNKAIWGTNDCVERKRNREYTSRRVRVQTIGVMVALGLKANAEDTVRTDRKTTSLYRPKTNPLKS